MRSVDPGCDEVRDWFFCTLPRGHEGAHLAQDLDDRVVYSWEDDDEEES